MEASEQRRSFGDRGGFRGRGRSNSRGRGGGDRGGGFRGGRGNFRGRGDSRGGRGGFRGGRGDSPGGFRGGRGGSPGGFRGGRGGSPGGFRGGRGSSPGGFRGGRGSSNFRGRGGFQRDNDKANGVESTEQQGGFRGRGSFRSGSRGRDSRGRGNFRGSGFRGERGGRGGRGGRGQGRPSSDNSFLKNIKTDSEQKTNEKQSTQDVKRKQKLAPSDTKQAVLISNLPKKVETVHKDFQAFISKTVGPVKLITYNKLTTPKSAAVSAICVFEEESDFKAAIEKLHGQEFSGHHLLVQSFKDSKFDTHHTSKNCVCVANMADKTTEEDLWKLFEGCGDLGMIHINRNTATGSPYEAVVNFKDRESVSSAVDLDGSKVLESTVKVVNLDRKFSVLVTNIDRQLTNQEFRDFFSECNLVYFSFGAKKKKEQKTAFVFLADEAGYKKALKLNGNDLKGQPIKVVSSAENSSVEAYDVFSPMIPSSVSPAEAKKVYEAFGTVTNVLVPLKKNISRISFETEEQAQAAVQASKVKINGAVVSIHPTFNKAMRVIKKLKEKTEKVEAVKGSDTKKVKELKAAAIKKKVAPKEEVEEESDSDDDSGDELETEGNVKMEHEDDDDDDDEAASGEEDEDSAEDEEEEEDSDGEEEEEEDSAEEEEEDVSNGVMDLEAEEDEDEEGEDEDEEGDEEEEEDEMEDSAEDEDEGDSDEDMEVEETPKFKMNTKKTNGNKVALAPSPKVQNVLKRKMKNSGPIPKKQKKMTKK